MLLLANTCTLAIKCRHEACIRQPLDSTPTTDDSCASLHMVPYIDPCRISIHEETVMRKKIKKMKHFYSIGKHKLNLIIKSCATEIIIVTRTRKISDERYQCCRLHNKNYQNHVYHCKV